MKIFAISTKNLNITSPNRPDMKRIYKGNCKRETGYEWPQLIDLTGINGIQDIKVLDKDVTVLIDIKNVHVIINNEAIYIARKLLRTKKRIENLYIIIKHHKDQKCGYGSKILYNQVKHAKKYGFETLKCTAYKPEEHFREAQKHCVGYLIWGKLGYLMDSESLETFNRFLTQYNIEARNLHHLQTEVPGGAELWEQNGFRWTGKFDLDDNSLSLKILESYMQKVRN